MMIPVLSVLPATVSAIHRIFLRKFSITPSLRTPKGKMDNLTMITEAIAAGFEKSDIEKPLRMKLTGASWTAIGSIIAIWEAIKRAIS